MALTSFRFLSATLRIVWVLLGVGEDEDSYSPVAEVVGGGAAASAMVVGCATTVRKAVATVGALSVVVSGPLGGAGARPGMGAADSEEWGMDGNDDDSDEGEEISDTGTGTRRSCCPMSLPVLLIGTVLVPIP